MTTKRECPVEEYVFGHNLVTCLHCKNREPSAVEVELRETLRLIRQATQDIGAFEIVNMIDKALQKAEARTKQEDKQ